MKLFITYFLILLLSYDDVFGSPPSRSTREISNREIVGQATNIITTKLLKGSIDSNKNSVFAPIGFATILAVLSEGASDETKEDIFITLKQPSDRTLVRSSYRSVLNHLQGMDPHVAPQFRSWFYIYKNNSIDDDFKDRIENDYFVTVRNVEPYYPDQESKEKEKIEQKPVEVTSEKENLLKTTPTATTNSKDILEFDSFKMESGLVDETRIDSQKDSSKFDEVVEDRQYVEVPVIKDEMKASEQKEVANEQKKVANEQKEVAKRNSEQKEVANEKIVQNTEVPKSSDDAKKMVLPLKQYEEMEIMQAEESRLGKSFGGKSDDGASIISGNSLVGEKENPTDEEDKYEPKMLLFNGLYYRGNWATPFQHLRDEALEFTFSTSEDEKVPIKMMRSCGLYRFGDIQKLDSEAIEFPYDNIRYSMLVLVPKKRDGLRSLITDLSANSLSEITRELEEELIDVSLPKFEVESTSGAEKILAKEGLATLFTSKADFSGITKAQKLRIGELQQHVTMRVDEGSSTENFLVASDALERSKAPIERSIVIDRPFLFFVRDRIDDVIIVAGKISALDAFERNEPEIPSH